MYANNAGTGYANANIFYLFLGAQPQWGYCSSRTATFPIPFPASALFIVAVPKTTSTSATATGAEYLGTTSVNLYLHELRVGISQAAIEQWGMNIHGWVIFPIPFTKFRRLVTNHQGNVFMDSKARESNTLSGFTLDVADNSDQNKDAQWIAIGA